MKLCKDLRKEDNHEYHYLAWEKEENKNALVIAHGMAEHPARYNDFALFLNNQGYNIYAIYHEGHGEVNKDKLGHFEINGFLDCVLNFYDLILKVKQNHSKVILLGHSMGSFMSQEYLSRFSHNIDACILSGSSSPNMLIKSGAALANILYMLPGKTKQSNFMNNLSFGSYNKQFKPNRTTFDWLSRDCQQVDKYIEDPYCGFICTRGFYKSFLTYFSKLHKKKKLQSIRKDIPILIIGGTKDPVSGNGEGLRTLLVKYKNENINDVTLKLYDEARHEILNEINKEEVYSDIKDWMETRINEKNY